MARNDHPSSSFGTPSRPGAGTPTHPPFPARTRRRLTAALAASVTALALAAAPAAHAAPAHPALVTSPASLVNPFIGTANSANDFPGADVPYGMVQWSPDTPSRPDGGGYAYSDSSITGFSLTHLSGPGCGAEGDVPVLPTVGSVNTGATDSFSHSNETASPGYYSVALSNGVTTQLTVTPRSGMASFTFPSTTQANLIFKLNASQNGDSNTQFNVVSNTEVSGQATSGNFCGGGNSYTVYFDMVFNQSFASNGSQAVAATTPSTATAQSSTTPEAKNHPALHGKTATAKSDAVTPNTAANDGYVTFNTTSNQTVLAKVGVSYVSIANAVQNRATENPNWNFSSTESAAQASWNTLLGKVQTSGGTAAQQAVFYTALYHALLHPNIISDVNGQYYGFNGSVQTVDSGHSAAYANYSGWDIYRSQAQLEALTDPQAASDTAQSMIDDYKQTGRFPKWSEDNGETYVMVGDPADEILAEYYAFGARNFDTSTALTDMIAEATTANNNRPGLTYLEQLGYLPTNGSYGCCNFYGAAATTLEYNSADFAISAFAGALGDGSDQTAFANRAQDWQNIYDHNSGFVQPRDYSGTWTSGFNPTSTSNFVEEDGWQYTLMVPFNLHGLATAMGGNSTMNTYLNTVLSSLTGANGYTDLGNEPALDIPWEYDYTGEPYQTQHVVRQVQDQIWTDAPGGLAGNDDLGEMSAWYVWSALGMYPETPGTSDLALGSPLFTQIVLTLPSGNTLTINGNGAADGSPYVQSATWNGTAWNNAYVPGAAITSGGTLNFTLGSTANTSWAAASNEAPPSYAGNPTYTDIGVSADSAASAANFDGGGYSYSATALSAAGVNPGSTVSANGVNFTWPGPAAGSLDNYLANGQTVTASGSGAISFLGSASNGPSTGAAVVTYTDGSTQSVPITFSDWTLGGGGSAVAASDTTAITTTYRNHAGNSSDATKTYVFATKPMNLASGKTVASVRLPSNVASGALHVFALGFTSAASPAVGAVYSGVSSGVLGGLCLDDSGGGTTNGTHVQIYGCNGGSTQQWTIATNGTIQINGGCLDVSNSGTANGTVVQWWTCNNTGAQQWQAGAGNSLINPQSGKCLDDPGSTTTAGTQLQIYTCNSTGAQNWTLP
ncbi:lectin [Actinospica robiniae]|uniref:lectin n=1 Tax=Actinospica robiniae TaxID=304901 RepID=UPI000407AEDE|nr:lectin [Actinospica robiniae]